MWEVFFELGCQPASQLPSLSLPGSPILLGNAIGGIPDPEPIIPDSGVWWAAVRRRGGGDNRGKARSDPFELTEVKLNAQAERARRERERGLWGIHSYDVRTAPRGEGVGPKKG